jgi:hypothetical protein
MKVQTNIEVTVNDGVASSRSVILDGEIIRVVENSNGDKVAIYQYIDSTNGEVLNEGNFTFASADVQAFYDAVKDSLPADTDYNNRLWTLYYEAYKQEMVTRFAELTNVSEISIVE